MAEEIVVATSDRDYDIFGDLIREYWKWLQTRYANIPGFIDTVGSHQALDDELGALRARYGPPSGKTLLAVRDDEVIGGVAYRDLNDGSCEMKRLFVPDRYSGKGTGRRLCQALIAMATTDGYGLMRLDTGYLNDEALAMYTSFGFHERAPYHDYPANIMAHLRFLEIPLGGSAT